jgi:hypothetical protein
VIPARAWLDDHVFRGRVATTTSKPVSRICACGHPSALDPHDESDRAFFGEERRRLKIVPNAFGEKPVLKLMFAALIRTAESWRALRFTEFGLR